jgi:hypothetical protein
MPWEVHVAGPHAVLNELAIAFREGDPVFIRDDDQLILRSHTFNELAEANAVRARAEEIVEALSGMSRLLLQSAERLTVSNVTEVSADGARNIFVQLEPAVLNMSAGLGSIAVTHADGSVEEHRPSDPAPNWLAKALRNPAAARALRLRNAGSLSWADLYRLYEVIEEGAGGEDVIVAAGWSSRGLLRRFKHSANSVAVAGDQARHGVEPTQSPTNAVTLGEARALIDGLLRAWLDAV